MTAHQDTNSLCPVCLARIAAKRVVRGDQVYLEKRCPDHGEFSVCVWDGVPSFSGWQRPKIPTGPAHCHNGVERGCPFDCGLCPEHRQRSCTIIFEITDRCNLSCPVCYADAKPMMGRDVPVSMISQWFHAARQSGSDSNIQLSGGEPTMRDDLPEIIRRCRAYGFNFIQINTNGLRLAHEPGYAGELKAAGLASVFLQFDGTEDAIYRKLRGRNMLDEKLAVVETCAKHRIGVVLVPTLVPGINDHDIGNILNLAIQRSPVVRSVHFQPVSYFGRFPHPPGNEDRLTLPQLMRHIEEQTGGIFRTSDFKPPGCENSWCSFSANFVVLADGNVRPLGGSGNGDCCAAPIPADVGAAKAIRFVARQWQASQCCGGRTTDQCGIAADRNLAIDMAGFLARARSHTLSVSAMAFQDVWNLDLERVRDCCIHVMAPDTRLVPFCLYNLTGSRGQRLYRP